jgi:hypothetical protein
MGAVGKLPYGGMSFYWGHHIVGLHELGYDVYCVERQNSSGECYDPSSDQMTDDSEPALTNLREVLPRFSTLIAEEHFEARKVIASMLDAAEFA